MKSVRQFRVNCKSLGSGEEWARKDLSVGRLCPGPFNLTHGCTTLAELPIRETWRFSAAHAPFDLSGARQAAHQTAAGIQGVNVGASQVEVEALNPRTTSTPSGYRGRRGH